MGYIVIILITILGGMG